jgi:hypothetical protein
MSIADVLWSEIEKGLEGKSGVIPMGYERLCDYIDIAKHTMYTIGGETGTGKSTVTQDGFLIRPLLWYLENKDKEDIKLSIIYFGMERKMYMYTCRWISRLIFQEQGIYIPAKKILGRMKKDKQLQLMTPQEIELVRVYKERLREWEKDDLLICHEGSKNPSGISKYLEAFAKKHGTVHSKPKRDDIENILDTKTYEPNHPNHIVLVLTDHISILAPERESGTGQVKMNIDKFSRTMREARDLYGFSPVIVQQLNRDIANVHRQKLGDLKPKLSDFADSSNTSFDSDVILALYDPYRHATDDGALDKGYQLKKLKNDRADTFYRSLHVLKNSFDAAGFSIPMGLHPYTGILKTLPRKENITEDIYTSVLTGAFFLD